tara:strand:- start:56241 stop:56672 length:432 start_codon:yes stop_codon:yes gene_type:complete
MYTKVKCGPTAYFDVDDTLVMWDMPEGIDLQNDSQVVTVECRGRESYVYRNRYNIDLLIKMASRGHAIVVWSAGGADWAEAVVKALHLENIVDVVTGKATYYIDDLADPAKVLGKHGYFDINGKRADTDTYAHKEKTFEEPNS